MKFTNIHDAKTHFSKLIERVEQGEEIIIARAGEPVAKVVRFEPQPKADRRGGWLKGKIWISDDFDAPLPEEIARAFRGEGT